MRDVGLYLDVDATAHLTEEGRRWAAENGADCSERGYIFVHVVDDRLYDEECVPACLRAVFDEANRRRIYFVLLDDGGGVRVDGVPLVDQDAS